MKENKEAVVNPLLKGVFSNRSDDWATPDIIYNHLFKKYGVTKEEWFDPCPLGALEKGYNGLEVEWKGNVYINPPYSNIKDFVERAIKYNDDLWDVLNPKIETASSIELESIKIPRIIFLIPARTDTKYYKLLFEHGCKFTFIEGRLKFSNSKYSSTFPSVLVELNGDGVIEIEYLTKKELMEN